MSRFFLILILILSSLQAKTYPKLFEQLGTPLYKADEVFIKFSKSDPKVKKKAKYYHLEVKKLLALAKKIESSSRSDKAEKQTYFKALRKLQKDYDEITRSINAYLFKSIDANNYEEFTRLMNMGHDIFLENQIIKKRAMAYYVAYRTRGKIPVLDISYQALESDPPLLEYVKGHMPKVHTITEVYSAGAIAYDSLLSKNENIAFMGYGNHCFKSIDIRNFEDSSEVASFDFNTQSCELLDLEKSSNEKYLYLSDLHNGFAVLDISEPDFPITMDEYPQIQAIASVSSKDSNTSFVIHHKKGLSVLDISDKDNLKLLANYNKNLRINDIAYDDEKSKLYLAHPTGLSVLDVSTLGNPREIYHFPIKDGANKIIFSPSKELAYVASGDNGVHVLDLSKELEISLVSTCLTPKYAYNLTLSRDGEKLFISALNDGVYFINTKDPKDLQHVSTYKLDKEDSSALSATLNKKEDTLFISYGKYGLAKVSLKD